MEVGKPSDSCMDIFKRAGISHETARQIPDLVKQVKARRKQTIAETRAKKFEGRRIIALFREEGRSITRSHVAARLTKRGTMRSTWGRAIFDQVMDEEKLPCINKQ